VVILGAGCAGLTAALAIARRGVEVLVLEREAVPGGLACGVTADGVYFDKGPHIIHSRDPRQIEELRALAGPQLREIQRSISIKYLGRYFRFPLAIGEVLRQLPRTTVLRAGLSFLWHRTVGKLRRPAQENTETVLVRSYGRTLYRIFFEDYITNVWGIPPRRFSPAFARTRIPRMNLRELLSRLALTRRAAAGQVDTEEFVEKVEGSLYTTVRGFAPVAERMVEAIEELGGQVLLNAPVTALSMEGTRAVAVEYRAGDQLHRVPCRGVINTLPLRVLAPLMAPECPPAVGQAAAGLSYRAMVFVGLVASRAPILPSALLYIRDQPFNRVSELGLLGFPEPISGGAALVAEITCDTSDAFWRDDDLATTAVIDGLVENELLRPEEVVASHVYRVEHGYPIYLLGYEQRLATVLDFFAASPNMESAGRQGRFAYVNMHIAMKMADEAVERLLAKLGLSGHE
jgi:protoporphyrinogen oxidase